MRVLKIEFSSAHQILRQAALPPLAISGHGRVVMHILVSRARTHPGLRVNAAYQAPPSMGFSRQEYWNGVPSPSLTRHDYNANLERLVEKFAL